MMHDARLDRLEKDLEIVIRSQRMERRGWRLSVVYAPMDPESSRKAWPIYAYPPKLNEVQEVIGNPDIRFHLDTNEVKFRASFEILPYPIMIRGRIYQFPPEIVERQFAKFADEEHGIFIDFDPKPVKVYETTRMLPDSHAFEDAAAKWSEKFRKARTGRSESDYQVARYVAAQLAAIRKNTIETVGVAVAELNNVIKQNEPDYFELLENVMSGAISPEECMEKGKGVFHITLTEKWNRPETVEA